MIVDDSSGGEGGTSDESNDDESIFEGRRSKRPKSGSRDSSPGTIISINDEQERVRLMHV
jgi:hypothetical protein